MNIGIVGSRTFNDYELLATYLNIIKAGLIEEVIIVSGGAKGADHLAEDYAKSWGLETIIFKPDWEKYGKSAGFVRNQEIVNHSDIIVAFWDGQSRGTKDTILKAETQKKPTLIIYF